MSTERHNDNYADAQTPPLEHETKPKHPRKRAQGELATADLVDEFGDRIEIPEDKEAHLARDAEQTLGATGPTNWWRIGLVLLAILIALILILQLVTGGSVAPEDTPTPSQSPAIEAPAAPVGN